VFLSSSSLAIDSDILPCRTWQDWGLRSARKTAFHTAVQYYCPGSVGTDPRPRSPASLRSNYQSIPVNSTGVQSLVLCIFINPANFPRNNCFAA
jgi:hypothetical protein